MTYPPQPPTLTGDLITRDIQMTAAESAQAKEPAQAKRARKAELTDDELAAKTYTVVAPYVTLKTRTPDGERIHGFYAGAAVPDDVPLHQIRHHLTTGQIVAVGDDENPSAQELEDRAVETFRDMSARTPDGGGMFSPEEPQGVPQHVVQDRRYRDLALTGQMAAPDEPVTTGRAQRAARPGLSGEATGKQAKTAAKEGGDPAASEPGSAAQSAQSIGSDKGAVSGTRNDATAADKAKQAGKQG